MNSGWGVLLIYTLHELAVRRLFSLSDARIRKVGGMETIRKINDVLASAEQITSEQLEQIAWKDTSLSLTCTRQMKQVSKVASFVLNC